MSRGGKRKGAGRKARWNAGKTKAVKLPESLVTEILKFAETIDSVLVDGLYGQEKIEDEGRLVDILFDKLVDRRILEQVARKLLTLSTKENQQKLSIAEDMTRKAKPSQSPSEGYDAEGKAFTVSFGDDGTFVPHRSL